MSREAKTFWLCVLKGIAITIGGLLATALVFRDRFRSGRTLEE